MKDQIRRWWPVLLVLLFSCCTRKEDPGKTLVYITGSGTRYHHQGCPYLGRDALVISLTDAIQRGYTPCTECYAQVKPATQEADTTAPAVVVPREQTAGQRCAATTKKGTRCKRTTTDSSGYCWQHRNEKNQ